MRKTILVFVLIAVVPGMRAQTLTSGGDFLKIPVGGRNASMAEAQVAAVNDIEAIQVNPAGLAHLMGIQAAYEHQVWIQGVNFDTLSAAIPLKMVLPTKALPGVAGLTVNYLYSPPIVVYDAWSEPIDRISFNAFQLRLGYALQVFQNDVFRVFAGGNASLISKSMKAASLSAKGRTMPAIDLAAQAVIRHGQPDLRKIIGETFTAGVVFRNVDLLGADATERWPIQIKVGAAAKIYDLVLVDIDLFKDLSSPFAAVIGAEYWLKNLVAFRAGGKLQAAQTSHLSFGLGFKYKVGDYTMFLDYAVMPGIDLTHKVAFKVDISRIPAPDVDLLYYRGIDYFVHGNYPQAIKMWERVLQRNPGHAGAKKRIQEAKEVMRKDAEEEEFRKGMMTPEQGKDEGEVKKRR